MYGYIKPRMDALSEEEGALYRAMGCGLCRAMRQKSGLLSACFLHDDMIFLSLCLAVCEGGHMAVREHRCPLFPFRRRTMVETGDLLFGVASVAATIAYLKKRDDLCDRGLRRRLRALAVLPLLSHARRRAAVTKVEERLQAHLSRLAAYEREGLASLDLPAEETGGLLGELFCATAQEETRGVLYRIGFALGRLIYLLDALDDLEEDERSKNYNPYLLLYKEGRAALPADAEVSLSLACSELADAVEALRPEEGGASGSLLGNIVYLGIPDRCREIVEKLQKGEEA